MMSGLQWIGAGQVLVLWAFWALLRHKDDLPRVLGPMSTKVILGALFALVVVPVALVRRWAGKDPMRVREYRRGSQSVLIARDHTYSKDDLLHPF